MIGHRRIHTIVFLTSFVILAYEINFTRVFAFTQWHNLSALIITMALLGFGASGTVTAVLQRKIKNHYSLILFFSALFFPLFLGLGFIASFHLDVNPYELSFSPKQVVYLCMIFLLMGTGFFSGAVMICMAFISHRASHVYFANLAGSAAGGLFVLCFSFLLHPIDMMIPVIVISLIPVCFLSVRNGALKRAASAAAVCITIAALFLSFTLLNPRQVSQYKSISGALTLPNARIIHEAYSPLGVVQVVAADSLRSITGLSLACPYQVPVQKIIFFDGEGGSPITPFAGNTRQIQYLGYQSSYLPFYIQPQHHRNRVLVIGPGGGESILRSVLAGFKTIDAIEADQNIIDLMTSEFSGFSGRIYQLENVNVMNREARDFVRQTDRKYDLIEFSTIDSYHTAASGVYALNETYLYTVDSVKGYYQRLSNNGMLAFTRWVVTPARDNLKLFNIVITALKEMGIENPEDHLIAVRSLQTMTFLVTKNAIRQTMIFRTKSFARDRFFDLVYYPGIKKDEVNQYIRLETPTYYQAMKQLMSDERNEFVGQYDFDIRTATDDRPYFYNFFKPKVVRLILNYGISQIPVTEWGYLLLLIILFPVLLISAVFMLTPLLVLKAGPEGVKPAGLWYFSLIGMGFFFIEMPLIQKMILFLGHPVVSISIIICSLLFFSGIGSYFSDRLFPSRTRILVSTVLIVCITGIYTAGFAPVFEKLIIHEFAGRCMVVICLLAPLGFFMGIPFPAGLELIKARSSHLVPFAWGVNGFFSVISILLAALLAVVFGFHAVFILSACFYLSAGIISYKYMYD